MSLLELLDRFPNNEACRQHLIHVRWPGGVCCPKCDCDRVSELPKRKQWTCLGCRYRFSATAGTIFHKTHIGLRKWFIAIFIVLNAKKGISSLELNRQLGISQECCWHLCHRIREAMRENHDEMFDGIVQADEYYHGGDPRPEDKGKLKGGRGSQNKTPILGAVESDTGRIRTKHVADATNKTIVNVLGGWLDLKNTTLHTDQWVGYRHIGRMVSEHSTVNHDDWYVSENGTHVNTVECAWSLFARAVMGSFHKISRKHLHRYLSEFDSRFNARKAPVSTLFDRVLRQADGRMLSNKVLTAAID